MKAEDVGLIVGVVIMLLFGTLFTFVIPRYIVKHDAVAEGRNDGRKMARWMRILGSIVLGVSVVQLIIFLFLNNTGT